MIHRSWLGLARRIEGLAAHLHQPVGVGEGAGLFGEGGGRQDHVGEVGGLGQEDVLHHQVIQRGQRFARMVGVGVGHRRVLAHDVHAAHLAGLDRVHHLDHRQAGLVVERPAACPRPSRSCARRRVVHALVVREHHRYQAGVGRALHIVLAAQRMQAGAGPADLARHQRPARSGSAHCRCRARAARRPCPTGSSTPSRSHTGARRRAASRRRCRRSAPSLPGCSPRRCSCRSS